MGRRLFNILALISLLLVAPASAALYYSDVRYIAGWYVHMNSGDVCEPIGGRWMLDIVEHDPWPGLMVALTLALPVAWYADLIYREHRARRRRSAQRCPTCGYDLRATPGRCPECGAIPFRRGRDIDLAASVDPSDRKDSPRTSER